MKSTIYIINIFTIFLSISYSESLLNVAFFNFNDKDIDSRNEVIVNLSEQISDDFIDIMKDDMLFIEDINFISTNKLDKELLLINKALLDGIVPSFKEDFAGHIPRDRLIESISHVSSGLTEGQINSLADSIIISVEEATKDITKGMMDSDEGSSDIAISNLGDFISRETAKTLKQSIFSSLIASSKEDFNTDIVVVGKYSIIDNEINVNLFLYNYDDFSLIDMIHSKSFMDKVNILIKDLEFKLLTKLGVILDNSGKEKLCKYNIKNFSRKDYSLYFSNIFESNDIKEIKYRLQVDDDYNFLNNHYESFFNSLIKSKIKYKIKFYRDDNYFRVFSTESANNNSIFIDVLKSTWSRKVGGYTPMAFSNSSKSELEKSKTIMEVSYNNIEAIYFKKDQDSFANFLKQVTIYSLIIASGFLLSMLL